jgi:predicted lipid-binding transport protein (Tim44 family)
MAMVGVIMLGTLASLDAEARRMGGGRSFGRQSNTLQRDAAPPAQPSQSSQNAMAQRAQPAPAAAPAAPGRSRWLGPIAGLAAGLGIAALLSHFGLGGAFAGAMANFLVIAAIAMIAIWLIRKFMARKRDGDMPAYAGGPGPGATLNQRGSSSGYQRQTGDTAGYAAPLPRPGFMSLSDESSTRDKAPASTVPANFD